VTTYATEIYQPVPSDFVRTSFDYILVGNEA